MSRFIRLIGGVAAICAFSGGAVAQTVPPSTATSSTAESGVKFAAWNSFVAELAKLGDRMLAKLPERLQNNPQIQQEVGQVLLTALASNTIEQISSDGDHPVFLPWINSTLNIYQPNADTIYLKAQIAPAGMYRLRGERGSLRIFKMAQAQPLPNETGTTTGRVLAYNDFDDLQLDEDGRFDVILSPTRPEGYTGDWWKLEPEATSVWVRKVASDWARERDPKISIERLDKPVRRLRPDAAQLEQRLRILAQRVHNNANYHLFIMSPIERVRQAGYVNHLREWDTSNMGGLVGQFYYDGAYDLSPDEALLIEAEVPESCKYWSVILVNDVWQTMDWSNNQSSLNDSQAKVDEDGVLRIIVANKDPGIHNWLDTAGHLSGLVQGRWADCASAPIPTVRKIAFADINASLPQETPKITPADRERIIRDRRAYWQQRPW